MGNKNVKHTILYVLQSVHLDGRRYVNDKKIGISGKGSATLRSRISQLSNTKNNFGAQCVAAWEVPHEDENSAQFYERCLHQKFRDQVIHCNGARTEWFYDDGDGQLDIVREVSNFAEKNCLLPIDVTKLQDANAKALAKKVTRQSFDHIHSMVSSFSTAPIQNFNLTRDCVRITTNDGRSFHINVRADLNKQYISISKTKENYERFIDLCRTNNFKQKISKKSGNIRVYVRSPREMSDVIDAFYEEGTE